VGDGHGPGFAGVFGGGERCGPEEKFSGAV